MVEDESWLKEVFKSKTQNPYEWLEAARRLKISADIIFSQLKQLELSHPSKPVERQKQWAFIESYMMLSGFALENLLKGIYVAENPDKINLEKIDLGSWGYGGHALVDLNKSIPVEFNQSQKDLLKELQNFTIWAGRYPLPISSSKFKEIIFNSDDSEIINNVFQQLEEQLSSYLQGIK